MKGDIMNDIIERFTSRKFVITVLALLLVTADVAQATDIAVVIAPFVGLEGLADAVERHKQK